MHPPPDRSSNVVLVIRIVGGALAAIFAVPFLLGVWWAVAEELDTSKRHVDGFGSLPGIVMFVPSGLMVFLLLPLTFPLKWWPVAFVVSVLGYVALMYGLLSNLET